MVKCDEFFLIHKDDYFCTDFGDLWLGSDCLAHLHALAKDEGLWNEDCGRILTGDLHTYCGKLYAGGGMGEALIQTPFKMTHPGMAKKVY